MFSQLSFKFIPFHFCITMGYLFFESAFADLIFTAPPREDQEKAKQLYEPIADKLSSILGTKVVFEAPSGWSDYTKKMREDYYDIVFDGPHFAAWRVKHLKHTPVAALPGRLNFLLLANADDSEINSTRDLVGKKICGMFSPHLATDLIYDLYPNPVLQPEIHAIPGSMKQVYKAFKEGQCRATIFRKALYKKFPQEEKKKLKIIARTRSVPNQTVTVSHRLQGNAQEIAKFLTSQDGALSADKLLDRFSRNNKKFEKTHAQKYSGAEDILEGVVWGW